ncbi:MAG TPA: hypothetical protein VFY32_08925 [Solirubrobacteraceae bacterium]|nr:hypothetical protein [Solirubrobacteraceae bacterium]
MTDQGEPFYDDDGDQIGWLVQTDDGNQVLHDGESILAAATASGVQLDPSSYTLDAGPESDPRVDELMAWAEQLEQQRQQQQVEPQQDETSWWQEIADQKADVEARLGRSLSLAEGEAISQHVVRQERRGETVDLAHALEQAWRTGDAQPIDLDTHEGRVSHMTENLQRSEREAAGADPTVAAPQRDYYDLSDGAQRRQLLGDRLSGALDDDAAAASTWDSSEPVE